MNERLAPNEFGRCTVNRFYGLGAKIQAFVFGEFFHMSAEGGGTQGTGGGGGGLGGALDLYIRSSHMSLITRYQGEQSEV